LIINACAVMHRRGARTALRKISCKIRLERRDDKARSEEYGRKPVRDRLAFAGREYLATEPGGRSFGGRVRIAQCEMHQGIALTIGSSSRGAEEFSRAVISTNSVDNLVD
jgi:hypothetical protein